MSVIDTLITDRTQADESRAEQLAAKGWAKMTAADREEWLASDGAYNATDLNRVGEAMKYIAEELREYALSVSISPRTNWAMGEIPKPADIDGYLADLKTLRAIVDLPAGTPAVPANLQGMTPETANDIERILQTVHRMLLNIAAAWFYSGEVYSGEI